MKQTFSKMLIKYFIYYIIKFYLNLESKQDLIRILLKVQQKRQTRLFRLNVEIKIKKRFFEFRLINLFYLRLIKL